MQVANSSGETSSNPALAAQAGPVHVLMTFPPSSIDPRQKRLDFDPLLQSDYISKRRKAHDSIGTPGTHRGNIDTTKNIPSNSLTRSTTFGLWDGVSVIEQALVYCCEQPDETEVVTTGGYPVLSEAGALDMEKEVRFAGLLARECHSMASRALALAILERTLLTYLVELEDSKNRSSLNKMVHDESNDITEEAGENHREVDEEDGKEPEEDEEDEEDVHDHQGGSIIQRRRSRRLRKQQSKYKRTKRKSASKPDCKEDEETNNKFDYEKWSRLEQFFAAGGLKILNQWLIEASKEVVILPSNSLPGSKSKSSLQQTVKPSATRPLVLPILRFLEHIPFDKKLVVDSKINKQIKKIEKQVDGILEARARGKHRPEDLQNWTTEPTSSETDALDHIKDAIDQVKHEWGERAKTEKDRFGDPFELVREKMRERLEVLMEFEAGNTNRPDWFEDSDESKKDRTSNNMKQEKISIGQRCSTQELAARERKAEREEMQKRLRAAQNEHREHLARLRELRKSQENSPSKRRKRASDGKEVKWKDGMKTKTIRDRKILEEVFVFDKETPANKDMNAPLKEPDASTLGQDTTYFLNKNEGEGEMDIRGGDNDEDDDFIDITLL